MATYVFPGQGSQVKGMGGALFAEFADITQKADAILGYSIEQLCLEDPDEQLNKTNFTQPALYTVNALSFLKKMAETGRPPEYVAGHSLGEYNALFAAGVFDFETGLKLVQKRGALMSMASGGGMAAVVGLNSDKVKAVIEKNNLKDINIANYNSFTQMVISGPKEAIQSANELFIQAGAMLYMPLKVSGAFHSPYMENSQREFAEFIKSFNFSAPKIFVIANVTALPYQETNIQNNLIQQISHSVMWTQSIEYLLKKGENSFTEIGPGKVLAGLINRIQKGQ